MCIETIGISDVHPALSRFEIIGVSLFFSLNIHGTGTEPTHARPYHSSQWDDFPGLAASSAVGNILAVAMLKNGLCILHGHHRKAKDRRLFPNRCLPQWAGRRQDYGKIRTFASCNIHPYAMVSVSLFQCVSTRSNSNMSQPRGCSIRFQARAVLQQSWSLYVKFY